MKGFNGYWCIIKRYNIILNYALQAEGPRFEPVYSHTITTGLVAPFVVLLFFAPWHNHDTFSILDLFLTEIETLNLPRPTLVQPATPLCWIVNLRVKLSPNAMEGKSNLPVHLLRSEFHGKSMGGVPKKRHPVCVSAGYYFARAAIHIIFILKNARRISFSKFLGYI